MRVNITRRRLHISGVVQGVGFRPHVYGLAHSLHLDGFVGNNSAGVFVEIQGETEMLDQFISRLHIAPPPLAHIESIGVQDIPVTFSEPAFSIRPSEASVTGHTAISPDIATCDACLDEMLDPNNRRYRYPFINCTNCGPRFTIILDTPYDRPQTTMARFPMCASCQAEYCSPGDRRFHAQPNACPECGPKLAWRDEASSRTPSLTREDALGAASQALARGAIVAIKGVGGFHLAVDATNEAAVLRLREHKHRWGKPLAIMVRDLAAARAVALVSDAEARTLEAPQRPIVLLQRATITGLAPGVAPGTHEVGIMLPYSGLHTLLMECGIPLVMTSGNRSNEPIFWKDHGAIEGLRDIADGFLLHDRDIHVPCDDSVVRVWNGCESPIRRSRGYAPLPVHLAGPGPAVLAVGAELKSTFCLTRHDYAFLSQHIGDMESYETLSAFERALDHFQRIFRTQPQAIACDLHPNYLSSTWARKYAGRHSVPLVEVQHHHAHLCSAMAEHGLHGDAPILGAVFDGTGYGPDGAVWGGEILVGDYHSYKRLLQLRYTPMPGGDASVRHPYRMALAHLWAAGVEWTPDLPCVAAAQASELNLIRRQLDSGFQCVPTSSMGRLFDAAAALIGIRQSVVYEAQAAIELEACSAPLDEGAAYDVAITDGEVDLRPIVKALAEDVRAGVPRGELAARFQRTVVQIVLDAAGLARESTGINSIALTGGVWQNSTIATHSNVRLREMGFKVLEHRIVPANDGGLALGQAAIASAACITRGNNHD